MKQCPSCKTTYTDDSLRFCLSDGTSLVSAEDEQRTVVRSAKNAPLAVEAPIASVPANSGRSSGSSTLVKVLIAVVVLTILLVVGLGLAGAAFYYGTGTTPPETPVKIPSPSPSATTTPDPETERLRDELANIQKKLEEQKKTPPSRPTPDPSLTTTVTANSPADGFLALRSEPNSETGKRIAKIPHGAKLQIGACGDYITTQKNNYGRWCRAAYSGYSGWVFDKYVIY